MQVSGGMVLIAGGLSYLMTDMKNFVRKDITNDSDQLFPLYPDEREILYLSSLAPSGHNTQPWFVKYIEPYHWIICNDKSKWLPAVDPTQRETILSIGAFIQNMEYAASHYGYCCQWNLLSGSNQDENIMQARLLKTTGTPAFDISKIKQRRTVRSKYLNDILKKEHLISLTAGEERYFHYVRRDTKEFHWLNEQTIGANRQQIYRDAAEKELGDWIRFSNKDSTTASLLETGKRLQRLLLQIREKGIAIHPMTQVLEENPFSQNVNRELAIMEPIQFILRCGYINNYPDPVSLRRPVKWFLRN